MIPGTTVEALGLTLLAYLTSIQIRRRYVNVWTTPILTTFALLVAFVTLVKMPFDHYERIVPFTSLGLGPACAALGVVVFRQRSALRRQAPAMLAAILAGSIVTCGTAVALATLGHASSLLVRAIFLKSVTTPVAVQSAAAGGIDPSLMAVVVVLTGALGAIVGPSFLTRVGVRDPLSRGVALGTISHGIGTAQASLESEVAGAASSTAMCVVALVMALAAKPLMGLLGW